MFKSEVVISTVMRNFHSNPPNVILERGDCKYDVISALLAPFLIKSRRNFSMLNGNLRFSFHTSDLQKKTQHQ